MGSCKYQPAYRRPNTKFFTVCKPYANLILTLTNQAPLRTNKALAASSSSFIVVKIYLAFDKQRPTKFLDTFWNKRKQHKFGKLQTHAVCKKNADMGSGT